MAAVVINTDVKLGEGTLAKGAVRAVDIIDTRNDNRNPQWYFDNYANQVVFEFKLKSTLGIVHSGGVFVTLETFVPWGSMSGEGIAQRANNMRDRTSFYRVANQAGTGWTDWLVVH